MPRRPLRSLIAFYAAMFVLLGLVSFGVLEVLARVFDPLGVSYYPDTARYMDTLVLGGPIGYRNRPGLEGRFYGASVRINTLGMRDRDVAPEPASGEYRVALVGDSFLWGIGVTYEDSIAAQCEHALNAKAPMGTRFRTLNFGVPSYNTEQELIQFEDLGLRLRPRAVALVFTFNDIYPKMWVLEKRRSFLANYAQRSYALALIFSCYQLTRSTVQDPKADPYPEYYPENPGWGAIDRSMTALNARCRAEGIPLVVFSILRPGTNAIRMLTAVGARERFPVVNLPIWPDPPWSGSDPFVYQNSRVDSHPNAAASKIWAQLIDDHLARLGAVPVATNDASPR